MALLGRNKASVIDIKTLNCLHPAGTNTAAKRNRAEILGLGNSGLMGNYRLSLELCES